RRMRQARSAATGSATRGPDARVHVFASHAEAVTAGGPRPGPQPAAHPDGFMRRLVLPPYPGTRSGLGGPHGPLRLLISLFSRSVAPFRGRRSAPMGWVWRLLVSSASTGE